MVDPDPSGDNKDYYELQIDPQNKVFKSQFDTLQQPSGGPNGPFGHEDWDPKLKSAVQMQKGADGKSDRIHRRGRDSMGGVREGGKPPAEVGRRVANQLLRNAAKRGRCVVADPRTGKLPQGVALREGDLGHPGAAPAASALSIAAAPAPSPDGGRAFAMPRLAMPMRRPPVVPQQAPPQQ